MLEVESVLEVDDDGSDDDDKSDGEGLSSGEEGGLGEAPGEFGDIADCAVDVNIDFGIEIPSSDELSCISVTDAEATKYPFLERIRHYMGGKQIDTYNQVTKIFSHFLMSRYMMSVM